jgi:hypothetical protein
VTAADVLASFRATFGDCVGWREHHLAHCPDVEVLRYEVTGEGTFTSVLHCLHRVPMGYSVLPPEEDGDGYAGTAAPSDSG